MGVEHKDFRGTYLGGIKKWLGNTVVEGFILRCNRSQRLCYNSSSLDEKEWIASFFQFYVFWQIEGRGKGT